MDTAVVDPTQLAVRVWNSHSCWNLDLNGVVYVTSPSYRSGILALSHLGKKTKPTPTKEQPKKNNCMLATNWSQENFLHRIDAVFGISLFQICSPQCSWMQNLHAVKAKTFNSISENLWVSSLHLIFWDWESGEQLQEIWNGMAIRHWVSGFIYTAKNKSIRDTHLCAESRGHVSVALHLCSYCALAPS